MKNAINLARVDFVTLRLYCAVVQAGSITKGAARCHLALSAASRRLREFEATVGIPLLERSVSGVTVTPAGHVAAQHGFLLLQGFEHFSSEIADFFEGYRGHVRLWANMSALTEFLPVFLAKFMARQPGIRVDIEEQLSGDVVRALLDGRADLGVFAAGTPADGLTVLPFRSDELVLLCPKEHPLGRFREIAFADALNNDFVGLNRGSSLLELTSRAAAQAGQALRLRVQVRSFDAMCQMIAAKLGVGVLPLAACQELLATRRLKVVRLTDGWARRQLVLGFSSERPLSTAAQGMVEQLQSPTD